MRPPQIASVVLLASAALLVGARQATPSQGTHTPATGPFHRCAPEIADGDKALNALKDRVEPPPQPAPATVAEVMAYAPPAILTGLDRSRWPAADLALAAAHEHTGVVMEGFLVSFAPQPRRAWNCYDPGTFDLDLFVGPSPNAPTISSIAAVISPRWQGANPAWSRLALQALAASHPQIRVTGWILFADDAADSLGYGTRASLWEIHPVTNIETRNSNLSPWHALAEDQPGH